MKNILVLCTGNSARSILGEALINALGAARFKAFSAGSFPKGAVNPGAIDVLRRNGMASDGYRSKSWDEFAAEDAPSIDIVITVCDNAAGETCPIFPGRQLKAHWGIADPADAVGDENIRQAFDKAFAEMKARVDALCALNIEEMQAAQMQSALREIGRMAGATSLAEKA